MADSKISALTDGGGLQADDELAVNRSSTSFKARGVGTDGWISDLAEIWTYASGSGGGTATFTVPGDQRAKYTVGTRIKLTQTTVKYFVVSADPTYDGTNTTVTITAGSDYTLANATISANYHSYLANPQGYPGWFNFAAAPTGFSSLTVNVSRFFVVGRLMTIDFQHSGTSNATTYGWTFPITVNSSANPFRQLIRTINNTTTVGVGEVQCAAGDTAATVNKTAGTPGGFTASGTKQAIGVFSVAI